MLLVVPEPVPPALVPRAVRFRWWRRYLARRVATGGDISCVVFAFLTRCGLFLCSALPSNAVNGSGEYFTLLIGRVIIRKL